MILYYILLALLGYFADAALACEGWTFDLLNQSSGVVVQQSVIVSPTLALFFDRAANAPLQVNNHSAWGAIWNLETHAVTPLDLITNSWCAGGALLSNGTMVRTYTVAPLIISVILIAACCLPLGQRWWRPTGF